MEPGWRRGKRVPLGDKVEERLALLGVMLIVLGLQTIFGAFFISVLGLRRRPHSGDRDAV